MVDLEAQSTESASPSLRFFHSAQLGSRCFLSSYDGDDHDPQDAPILRYLIRHFLLTLPLVRDTAEDGEIPSFWTDGLHPIIRAIHDADLSKPADRGFVGPVSRLYGSSMRNALERFVAAGLKLSSASHVEPTPDAAGLQRQRSNASSQRSKARSAAMSGVETSVPPPPVDKERPISSSTSTSTPSSSSWSQRFSFGRLFGSTTATPVKSTPVSVPPPIPTVHESAPSRAPAPASETDSDRDAGLHPSKAGRPRPDSAVLPALPFMNAQKPTDEEVAFRHTGSASSSRRASTVATRSRPLTPVGDRLGNPEMEELDLSRQATRTTNVTSAFDTASFVTAGEGTLASRTGHDGESDAESEADETARFPGSLFFSSAKPGPPPIALDQSSSAPETPRMPTASFAPTSSNGLEPAEMKKEGSSSTASGPIDGLEYYGSDAAATPKHEKEGFDLTSAAVGAEVPDTPKGKSRAFDDGVVQPYVVEDAATKLPPPVPGILPYASPASSPRQSTSSARRTLPSSPPLRPISSPQTDNFPSDLGTPPRSKSKFGLGSLLKKTHSRSASSSSSKSPTFAPASLNEVPASRRVPIAYSSPPPRKSEDFVAHMAIPHELLYPTAEESADGHAEETGAEVPEPILLPKGGVKWPWNEPVPFLQGPDFEQLKWGGFEADVIGVRKSLFSHVCPALISLLQTVADLFTAELHHPDSTTWPSRRVCLANRSPMGQVRSQRAYRSSCHHFTESDAFGRLPDEQALPACPHPPHSSRRPEARHRHPPEAVPSDYRQRCVCRLWCRPAHRPRHAYQRDALSRPLAPHGWHSRCSRRPDCAASSSPHPHPQQPRLDFRSQSTGTEHAHAGSRISSFEPKVARHDLCFDAAPSSALGSRQLPQLSHELRLAFRRTRRDWQEDAAVRPAPACTEGVAARRAERQGRRSPQGDGRIPSAGINRAARLRVRSRCRPLFPGVRLTDSL